MPILDSFNNQYYSYGGVDISLALGSTVLGNAQGLSLSITREKAPIFVMGAKDPVSFSRGKRGIAGSLVATMFRKDALAEFRENNPAANIYYGNDMDLLYRSETFVAGTAPSMSTLGGLEPREVNYADQILPFSITLIGANEYNGEANHLQIFGAEILNEGLGTSMGDTSLEEQMTFIARHVSPWKPCGTRTVSTRN